MSYISLHWQVGSLPLRYLGGPQYVQFSSVQSLSHVRLFVTLQAVTQQAPLSMGIL